MSCAVLGVAFPTWLQVISTLIAALAAGASWIAVKQARESADELRQDRAESRRPILLVSLVPDLSGEHPKMGLSIHNAGGGVAQNVAVLLVVEDAFARGVIAFLRPGETTAFDSELSGSGARAVVYARSQDGRELAWDDEGHRKELERLPSGKPEWKVLFPTFYPGEDLRDHRPTILTPRSKRSNVTVTVGSEPVPAEGGELKLTVVVRNAGERDELVEKVGLTFLDESATAMGESTVEHTADKTLAPKHNYRWTWDLGQQRFAVGRRCTGWAQLGTGEIVTAESAHFDAYSLFLAQLGDSVRPRLGSAGDDDERHPFDGPAPA